MIDLIKDNIETLNDFQERLLIFFAYKAVKIDDIPNLFSSEIYKLIKEISCYLNDTTNIRSETFKDKVNQLKSINNITGNIWKPIRIAITGKEHGPDISKFVEILGGEQCSNRINMFLENNVH